MMNYKFLKSKLLKYLSGQTYAIIRKQPVFFQHRLLCTSQLIMESCKLKSLSIKGWVKELQRLEKNVLVIVNEGTSEKNIKIMFPYYLYDKRINVGTPLVIKAENDEETNEIVAKKVQVQGTSYGKKQSLRHNKKKFEEIENERHLVHPRFRTRYTFYSSRFRARSKLKSLLHNYFRKHEFIEVDTTILTRYLKDSEDKAFQVESTGKRRLEWKYRNVNSPFDNLVYLMTCNQLHLQSFASGLNKVYSISPLFRNGLTGGRNLYEFWTVTCQEIISEEKKIAFDRLLSTVESLVKEISNNFIEESVGETVLSQEALILLRSINEKKWLRVSYDEAASIVLEKELEIGYEYYHGTPLSRSCQTVLLDYFDQCPLFITDHPYCAKSFNVAQKGIECDEVFTFDLILPHVGMTANGHVKEHDINALKEKLKAFDAEEYFSWFTNMHEWGMAPSMGFSIGIERLLYFLFKDDNVKNLIPFPRSYSVCES